MPIEPLQPEQKLSSEQKVQDLSVSPDIGNTHVSGLPLSNPEIQSADIVSLIFLCKLSDGTVRSVNTGRKDESNILELLEKKYGTIPVSTDCIKGVDIIIPS